MPPLLVLHLVILAWAFTAILGKLISLPALDMVVWRTGLATAGFILIALAMRTPLRLAKRDAGILFGLGAILYECLVGRVPFQGANGPQILLGILTKEPAPVSQAQGTKYPIPPSMDAVLGKASGQVSDG